MPYATTKTPWLGARSRWVETTWASTRSRIAGTTPTQTVSVRDPDHFSPISFDKHFYPHFTMLQSKDFTIELLQIYFCCNFYLMFLFRFCFMIISLFTCILIKVYQYSKLRFIYVILHRKGHWSSLYISNCFLMLHN